MKENIINGCKFLGYRLSPILIVFLLFEGSYWLLRPTIGGLNAFIICTSLVVFFLGLVTGLGYFNKVPLLFVIVTQFSVFCCGANSTYFFILGIIKNTPNPLTFNYIYHYLMSEKWYLEALKFAGFCIIPTMAALPSIRLMSRRPKAVNKKPKKRQNSTSFGSARFANKKEIEQINTNSGIVVGKQATLRDYSEPEKIITHIQTKESSRKIIYQKPVHSLLIAPSGYGKGVGVIIPTLLNYPGNVVVTDFKGENYCVTARRRRELGKKVYAFEPFKKMNVENRCKINVLDLLDVYSGLT